jgi:UDP-N-acetylglucosamine:LPS N-acetylglucosamine transferase
MRILVAAGHLRTIHYGLGARDRAARAAHRLSMTLLPGRASSGAPQNVRAVTALLVAGVRAFGLVGRLRPSVVVAVGGYASVAVGLAAVLRRVPIVVAEQNQAPGLANRLLARFAKAAAVSFPDTPLPRAVVTGNPIRAEISALDPTRDKAAAKRAFGVDEHRLLLSWAARWVLCGSTRRSSRPPAWRCADLSVHHVVGHRDWPVVSTRAPTVAGGALEHRMVEYEDDIPAALAAADLAVCRSGSACFELAAAGCPPSWCPRRRSPPTSRPATPPPGRRVRPCRPRRRPRRGPARSHRGRADR